MNQDFSELIEYLNGKFNKIDKRFEQVDQRFGQVDQRFKQADQRFERINQRFDQIDQRFEQMDQRFERIDQRFNEEDQRFERVTLRIIGLEEQVKVIKSAMVTKEDFNNLQTSVDAYAQKADTYFQEMLMLANKVDRHEKWLHQVADKLGIKLEY